MPAAAKKFRNNVVEFPVEWKIQEPAVSLSSEFRWQVFDFKDSWYLPTSKIASQIGHYLSVFSAPPPDVSALHQEVRDLRNRLEALEAAAPRIIVLRQIPRDRAKQELMQFFKVNPASYPSDAAVALKLDPELTRDLSEELVGDGVLERE